MNAAQASFTHSEPVSLASRLASAFGLRSRKRVLDIRDLPDHLKRDMGFLDGKRPYGRCP
ncbi:hypothetical protein [Mesorhizobium sp. ANAO-SY3R2]|uniref:hypothetical protein n=1 Tax=Mesorhizobium sp. ANAO-SY3R2 TaxID=3166644 RepID=UPI003673139B